MNIGGGPNFNHAGWINLDAVSGPKNPVPVSFGAYTVLPIASSTVSLVYSSHCFEHLDDATVARLLSESRRILSKKGELLLKIPDFSEVLRAWARQDNAYFCRKWNIESVTPTWKPNGVDDNIDSRAAMIFCGFWNDEYGDHFSGNRKIEGSAYHGPPRLSSNEFRNEMLDRSPHQIARALRERVAASEGAYHFNHQNAWSSEELVSLLENVGFKVESMNSEHLTKTFSHVPGIREMEDISLYCLAKPTREAAND